MCIGVLPAYMSVYRMCAWYLLQAEEGTGASGTGVTDGCELWMLGMEPGFSGRAASVLTW